MILRKPLAYREICIGAEGTRTLDLLVANQALSQLSYGPGIRTGPG